MAGERPARRLPGIAFATAALPAAAPLTRMDVAVFVGLAANGPLDTPVRVEDFAQYTGLFGGEVEIAGQAAGGRPERGYLPGTVSAFFANGGKRCWIIRVPERRTVAGDGEAGTAGSPAASTATSEDAGAVGTASFLPHRELRDSGVDTLLSDADALRYRGPSPLLFLDGIYAALGVEEGTLISVPDAVHCCRGAPPPGAGSGAEETPVAGSGKSRILPPEETGESCSQGLFDCCDALPPLRLTGSVPDGKGRFTLSWDSRAGIPPEAAVSLWESAAPSFADSAELFHGAQAIHPLQRGNGAYYYRARLEKEDKAGPWSPVVEVLISLPATPPLAFDESGLLDVHRALIRLCAARGDMSAVLSLPRHFKKSEALDYLGRLKAPTDHGGGVMPLGAGEAAAFSYAGLFHPWPVTGRERGSGALYGIPPDGAVCGLTARRSLAAGAWVAPANRPMPEVVALTPPIAETDRPLLADSRLNLLVRQPRGFMLLTWDTLADDELLRPMGVRRLLILIRKEALRKGMEYVFEPCDATFRRMAQREFESLLEALFTRGAFTGRTPDEAYRVETGPGVNGPQGVEQGRFVVELKVAPSRPLSFLTVRLLQTGDRLAVAEVP